MVVHVRLLAHELLQGLVISCRRDMFPHARGLRRPLAHLRLQAIEVRCQHVLLMRIAQLNSQAVDPCRLQVNILLKRAESLGEGMEHLVGRHLRR